MLTEQARPEMRLEKLSRDQALLRGHRKILDFLKTSYKVIVKFNIN